MPVTGNGRLLVGVGIGMVLAGVVRQIAPSFRGVGRPLAKAAVKATIALAERGRLRAEEFKEALEDLAAEARSELSAESSRMQADEQMPAEGEYATESPYHA